MTRARRSNAEGTFFEREGGQIQYRLRVDGRRITAYASYGPGKPYKSRTAAKDAARAKAHEKASIVGEKRSALVMSGLVDEWIEQGYRAHRLAPSTFDQYSALLKAHIVPVIGTRRVDAITRRIAAETVRGLTGSPSTRRSTYAAFMKAMEWAKDQGIIGVNVVRDVKRPPREQASARDITDDEAYALLGAAVGHRWEIAAWLGLGAGLRRGESLGLRWSDIDLDGGTANITGNVTRTSAGLLRGEPKTRRGRRSVPLSPELVVMLKAHRKRQTEERLAIGEHWQDSGHVLTNEIGGIAEPRALSRAWQSWAKAANIKDTGTHVARHFAATTLLSSGRASVADVAAMMGHDPAVLLSTYAAAVADGQRAAVGALGELLTRERESK